MSLMTMMEVRLPKHTNGCVLLVNALTCCAVYVVYLVYLCWFGTATTDVRLLRKLVMALKDYEAELRAVFPHYCRRGKVSNQRMSQTGTPSCSLACAGWQYDNVTHLNRKCWRQFAKECGLSAGSKDGGVVDVMFSTGVRHYNQDRFQASTNRCSAIASQPKFKSHSHPHHTSPHLPAASHLLAGVL